MGSEVIPHRRVPAAAACLALLLTTTPPAAAEEEPAAAPPAVGGVVVAGRGEAGYSGDGGAAADARIGDRLDIDVADDGTLYIADRSNQRLRAVAPDGTIDTVEGTRGRRSPDNDGPEVGGWFLSPSNAPSAVAVTDAGGVYVAARHDIRYRDADGEFTTVTDDEGEDFHDGDEGGDGGPAEDAHVYDPEDVAAGADGTLYIADTHNDRVRRVDADGTITTVAGGGGESPPAAAGGVDATAVRTPAPRDVAVDSAGTVYFTLEMDARVYRVDPDGALHVAAGTGTSGSRGDGGPATEAEIDVPGGLAVDADDRLLIADTHNDRVRRVDAEGTITTVAAVTAPEDVAVGPDGGVYAAGAHRVRLLNPGTGGGAPTTEPAPAAPDPWADAEPGSVHPVAGTDDEPSDQDTAPVLPPQPGELDGPRYVAAAGDGTVYVSDTARHRVLAVAPDGGVGVVAGTGGREGGFSGDGGPADEAALNAPHGLAVDAEGALYIADALNARVRRVAPDGSITTVAGGGAAPEETDGEGGDEASDRGDGGPAVDAVVLPTDLAVGSDGTLYVAEAEYDRIRAVSPEGVITTVGGGGERWADDGDGHPATEASLASPERIAVDRRDNVYFVERGHPAVRRIDADGTLTTVAGDSYLRDDEGGYVGDGGPAAAAELNTPTGLAVDADDRLLIADTFNSRVRRIDADGEIETVVGTGEPRDTGDGGPAAEAAVNEPRGIAVGPEGDLLLTGPDLDGLRRVSPDGVIDTVVGADALRTAGAEPTGGPATEVEIDTPGDLGVAPDGTLYVVDTPNHAVHAVDPDGRLSTLPTMTDAGNGAPLVPQQRLAVGPGGALYLVVGNTVYRSVPGEPAEAVVVPGRVPVPGEPGRTTPLAPTMVAVGPDGGLHVAGTDGVFRIESDGSATLLAGGAPPEPEGWEYADEDREMPEPIAPTSLAVGPDGGVYVAEGTLGLVRRIGEDGALTTVAGGGEDDDPEADRVGEPATELPLYGLRSVAVDTEGHVVLSSHDGIHVVDPDGDVVAAMAAPAEDLGDGSTESYPPGALTTDAHGNVYFVQEHVAQVRVLVAPTGSGPPWAAIGIRLLAAVLLFTGLAALVLRGELVAAVRAPGRIPGALATVLVLSVAAVLDACAHIERRFGR